MAAETHFRVGSTWYKAKAIHVRDSSQWRSAKELWVRDGTSWRLVYTGYLHSGRLTYDGYDGYDFYGYGTGWSEGSPGTYTQIAGGVLTGLYYDDIDQYTHAIFTGDLNGTGSIKIRKDNGAWQQFSRLGAGHYYVSGSNPFALNGSGSCNELYEVDAA